MQLTLSIEIMQVPLSVAIMQVLKFYWNYVSGTFLYSYVGRSFCCIYAVKSFCSKYVDDDFFFLKLCTWESLLQSCRWYFLQCIFKKRKTLWSLFYGWGSTISRIELLYLSSLLFLAVSGTHFTDLGRMKGRVDLGSIQSTLEPSIMQMTISIVIMQVTISLEAMYVTVLCSKFIFLCLIDTHFS